MDPFLDLIKLLRPRAMLTAGIHAAGHWSVSFRQRDDVLFCWVEVGECLLVRANAEPLPLRPGDFVLIRTTAPLHPHLGPIPRTGGQRDDRRSHKRSRTQARHRLRSRRRPPRRPIRLRHHERAVANRSPSAARPPRQRPHLLLARAVSPQAQRSRVRAPRPRQ